MVDGPPGAATGANALSGLGRGLGDEISRSTPVTDRRPADQMVDTRVIVIVSSHHKPALWLKTHYHAEQLLRITQLPASGIRNRIALWDPRDDSFFP